MTRGTGGGGPGRARARAAGATTTVGEVDSNFNKRKAISIWCLGWRAVISFRADRTIQRNKSGPGRQARS